MIYRIEYPMRQKDSRYICQDCLREREAEGGLVKVRYSAQWQGETCQFCREVGK